MLKPISRRLYLPPTKQTRIRQGENAPRRSRLILAMERALSRYRVPIAEEISLLCLSTSAFSLLSSGSFIPPVSAPTTTRRSLASGIVLSLSAIPCPPLLICQREMAHGPNTRITPTPPGCKNIVRSRTSRRLKTTWFWTADFCHTSARFDAPQFATVSAGFWDSPGVPIGSTLVAASWKELIWWDWAVGI